MYGIDNFYASKWFNVNHKRLLIQIKLHGTDETFRRLRTKIEWQNEWKIIFFFLFNIHKKTSNS